VKKTHGRVFRFFQLLAAPLKLAMLVGAVTSVMVYVNYTVDCSGLYQGNLTNRTIVELLYQGKAVSNFSQMDERAVLELYAAQMPKGKAPSILALGSSRVMQVTRQTVGQSDFYNCGLTGADYRDVMNEYYAFEKAGIVPDAVILNIDPWLLRGDDSALDSRADAALYSEFLALDLDIDSGYAPPAESRAYQLTNAALQRTTKGRTSLAALNITSTTLGALFEPAYFQGNVAYWQKRRASAVATTEDGAVIPYAAVSAAGRADNTDEIKMPDGTIWYSAAFRASDTNTTLSVALEQAGTFLRMEGYTQLDASQCALFERFVSCICRQKGVRVILPAHALTTRFVYEYEQIYNTDQHAGFFEVEPYLRQYAAAHDIPVVGSYDPERVGLTESDFYDGLHVKESAIAKYFGGLDADGNILPGSAVDSTLLAENPADDPDQGAAASAAQSA
jgi:hypothetical protein